MSEYCKTCKILLTDENCMRDKRRKYNFYKNCDSCRNNKLDFYERARLVHGDRYDYSKVEYTNNRTKVIIICKKHGEFEQTPNNHLDNQRGCPKCGGTTKLTTEDFKIRAIKIHGDKYDYSKTKYNNNNKEKVLIICKKHGAFEQTPHNHLDNQNGCPKCGGTAKLTTEDFKIRANKIHGDKYDYSKVDYINNRIKVIIICKEHGEFKQTPDNHLNQQSGCLKCRIKKMKLTTEEFKIRAIKIHGNKYDYSKTKYNSNKEKVIIICKEHGEFEQKPNTHLSQQSGCPKCNSSKLETSFQNILNNLKINFETQKKFKDCKNVLPLPFDFSILHNNNIILVELQGMQHYEKIKYFSTNSLENRRHKDKLKFTYAYDNHYFLSISCLCINFLEDILNNFLSIYENYEHFAQFYLTPEIYISYSDIEVEYPKINLSYLDLFQHVNHNLYDEKYYTCHLCDKEYHYDLLQLHYKTKEHRELYNEAKELESENKKLLDNGVFLIFEE